LSAGRSELRDELQALCFMAGASSIFNGGKLLTTGNPDTAHDQNLFEHLKTVAVPSRLSSSRLPRERSAP
jgi:biotin synthase